MLNKIWTQFMYYWFPPLLWMACIYYMSSQSSIHISTYYLPNFLFFKFLHVIEYALLFFLVFRAFNSLLIKPQIIAFLFSLGISTLYSLSDEMHQLSVPTRQGRIRDIIIDVIGMLIMYTVIKRIKLLKKLL